MRKKFFKKCLASTMALALVITGTNSIPALAAKKASVSLKKTSVSVTVGKNVKLSVQNHYLDFQEKKYCFCN